MGALRITGSALIIAGLVGVVASVVLLVGLREEIWGYSSTYLVGFLGLGILWGPLLIALGLGFFYASAQRRRKALLGSNMARWMMWAGIGVFVAGMIIFGLGFGSVATQDLLFYGSWVMLAGLVLLGAGGALKFVGALLSGVGIIGTVLGVVAFLGVLTGTVLGMTSALGYFIAWGIWWGPPMTVIGLISLLVAWQSRRPSPTS